MANNALAVAYAALALHDSKVTVSAENIDKLVAKAGVKLPAGFANVFVRSLGDKNVGQFIAVGGSGSGAQAAAPAAKQAEAAKPAEVAKPPPAPEPEEDVDMGGLFD